MMMLTLAQRELRALFLSPLAWTVLAVLQFILAYLFLSQLQEYVQLQPQLRMVNAAVGVTDIVIVPVYGSAAFMLMMVVPLLTMRVISDERRNQSLTLLFSAPLSMSEIVLGKYLGVFAFMAIMTGIITLMPLSLLMGTHLDLGLLAASVLGILLLMAAFTAIGVYMSTLTVQPTVAAVSTFGVLLLLWIINWAGGKVGNENASGALQYLSMLNHFEAFSKGIFNTSDVFYYLLIISTFMVLSIRRLDADRLQH